MPKAKKVLLHVGLGKTGTTALQHWFFDHTDLLHSQGICYPPPGNDPEIPKHQYLVDALLTGDMRRSARDLNHDSSSDTVLLSSEGLTHHLFDFDKAALKSFRDLMRDLELTVFVVLREYEAWTKSYYKQVIANPVLPHPKRVEHLYGTDLSFAEFKDLEVVRRYADCHGLFAKLRSAFGPDRLVAAPYESDWFGVICQLVGLSGSFDLADIRRNESFPDWLTEIIRQLNALHLAEPERQRLLALIGRIPELSGTNLALATGTHAPEAGTGSLERFLDSLQPGGWCDEAQLHVFQRELENGHRESLTRADPTAEHQPKRPS